MQRNIILRTLGIIAAAIGILAVTARAGADEAQVWHIKAIDPSGHLLSVKAIDADGGIHDVKAVEQSGNRYILDVKAFVDGDVLAVKVLRSDDWFGPVKAVRPDGTFLDIKAITADEQHLDVKAVSRAGHILDIKAIDGDRQFFGIKAVSPAGHVYDVKGIKMLEDDVELEIGDTPIRAHVKALPQIP